ncbi:glycosyltransferase [Arenicella xantha]|uniref:Glycosyl transferase family 2 n=1 Tax=Arenicella xantha TaxID=644221 RepID=A0A395JMS8_9GAMM|nr:glycosyltransferase [Arenicella xantha]RBP52940.1 glycosyl transferase family 2 [Arenicella xantha]
MNPPLNIAVVAAVSDSDILNSNLLRSPIFSQIDTPRYFVTGANSAAEAYNQGLEQFADKDVLILVHQDVYLPRNWYQHLVDALEELADRKVDWGVLGVFGKTSHGDNAGRVWDSGLDRELGEAFTTPVEVETLDELLLIVKPQDRLAFDTDLVGFHLFASDYCATMRSKGKHSYAIHAPVIHNSKRTQSLGGDYAVAYRYLQKKWHNELPLHAVCGAITKWGIQYKRIRFGLAYRRILKLIPNQAAGSKNPIELARQLGYE